MMNLRMHGENDMAILLGCMIRGVSILLKIVVLGGTTTLPTEATLLHHLWEMILLLRV